MSRPAGRSGRPSGIVLDLDGTLVIDDAPVPGAVETLTALGAAGLPVCVATNTTRRPRAAIVEGLLRLGIDLDPSRVITAPCAAAAWLEAERVGSVALYVASATESDFGPIPRDDTRPEAVVVGDLGGGWSYARLDRAFQQLMQGARLVALQRNRYWRSRGRLVLDGGPFVAALEYAAGVEATLVGKPSASFFAAAARALGAAPETLLMVGDDVQSDVRGAMASGMTGVLVRTGKFRSADLSGAEGGPAPDAVLDSVADLPAYLGLAP